MGLEKEESNRGPTVLGDMRNRAGAREGLVKCWTGHLSGLDTGIVNED